jgi:hypothetical protein
VFTNIAIDEGEHVKTMQACQDYAQYGVKVVSPHLRYKDGKHELRSGIAELESEVNKVTAAAREAEVELAKRERWKKWSEEINQDLKP